MNSESGQSSKSEMDEHEPHESSTSQTAVPDTIDFDDTAIAFARLSDDELKRAYWLFKGMSSAPLVKVGSFIGPIAVKLGLPFAERLTVATLYRQFVGGRTLLEVEAAAATLAESSVLCVLDYGAEGKDDEVAYNGTMTECIRAIEFASTNPSICVVTTKLTGLASDDMLKAVSSGVALSAKNESEYKALTKRVDSICHVARERGVQLYVDAEESWIQPAIDKVVTSAMLRYNSERAVIVNTYQLYRHDRLATLMGHHAICCSRNVILGAKLVRGAYMNKEARYAETHGLPTPIHATKAASDQDFDRSVEYCLDNIDTMEFINASHNQRSAQLMLTGMAERGIARNHPGILLCQLYGMSDTLTFNLAAAGYRVGKYVPYGPVKDVVPYLVRRAQENSSITGETGRELRLIQLELDRRARVAA